MIIFSEGFAAQLEALCLIQATDEKIADYFGDSVQTIRRLKRDPQYAEIFTKARAWQDLAAPRSVAKGARRRYTHVDLARHTNTPTAGTAESESEGRAGLGSDFGGASDDRQATGGGLTPVGRRGRSRAAAGGRSECVPRVIRCSGRGAGSLVYSCIPDDVFDTESNRPGRLGSQNAAGKLNQMERTSATAWER